MTSSPSTGANWVAIVDHGLGNLRSVLLACQRVGLPAAIVDDPERFESAGGIILPGVGAFGDAMDRLNGSGLASAIRRAVGGGVPLLGICLGMQLLFTRSSEFGAHEGLGLLEGEVVRFSTEGPTRARRKVPQVGWNGLAARSTGSWDGTQLEGVPSGTLMYFVHSYYVVPEEPDVALATTNYAGVEYCSALATGNLFGCQFHPERSATRGLQVYRNFAQIVGRRVPV